MATKYISAGEVLTVSLLKRIDKRAYQVENAASVGFMLEGERSFKVINGTPVWSIPTAVIEQKYIKGDVKKFLQDFKKTMNSACYKIKLI